MTIQGTLETLASANTPKAFSEKISSELGKISSINFGCFSLQQDKLLIITNVSFTIRSLTLKHSSIGAKGAREIAKLTKLEWLSLIDCEIGDEVNLWLKQQLSNTTICKWPPNNPLILLDH